MFRGALWGPLIPFVLLLSNIFNAGLHIKQHLFNKFYTLCHIEDSIYSIFQCEKRVLCSQHVVFVTFNVTVSLCNKVLQLLIDMQIKRCQADIDALITLDGIAYGLHILFKNCESFLYNPGIFPSYIEDADNHNQCGDKWRPSLQEGAHNLALFKRKNRDG